MKCLVLAAGMSTRLAALTGGAPKPLVPVQGVPVLHRNLKWLAAQGFREVWVNLHYRAGEIQASIGDGSAFGLRVAWSQEQPVLGTAGAARKLARELEAEARFAVVYGDNVFGFDLSAMLSAHLAALKLDPELLGTIAVFDPARNPHTGIAGGRVAADGAGRITGFVEGQPDAAGFVNAACYVLESSVLRRIPEPPQASDWARDIFPEILRAGGRLRAHLIDGYCLGIDTPAAYQCAQELFARGQVR